MFLECRFTAPVCRVDPIDYVREVEVDVTAYDAAGSDRFVVGRLALDQVLWAQALADGVPPLVVCDAESQELGEVGVALTTSKGEFRKDLRLKGAVEHVLLLRRFVLHPDVGPFRRGILDAALIFFGSAALAVLWRETDWFTEAELAELGFAKVARTELIFRHAARRSRFRAAYPRGQPAAIAATTAHREWVEREWERIVEEEGKGPGDG